MKLIDKHKRWCEIGRMSNYGLCASVPGSYQMSLGLIKPTNEELIKHREDGYSAMYWGERFEDPFKAYTPLRQTIVLLICAMNNEI